jgi:uncharacterized protein YcfL
MRKLVVIVTALALSLLVGCSSDVGSCVTIDDAGAAETGGSDTNSAAPVDALQIVDAAVQEDGSADGSQNDDAAP